MSTSYYPINEDAARRSKELCSFDDYRAGSATAGYRSQVDEAAALAAEQIAQKPDYADEINRLLDRYARKLAEYYNNESRIGCMCASVMIAGPANFPVRKKQKQVAAWEKNQQAYSDAQALLQRMRSVGTGGIRSDDARAVEKLQEKIEDAEESQQTTKDVNAYYRKHGTLDGCTVLSDTTIESIKAAMARDWHKNPVPFEPWALSNNSANIRRMKERVQSLQREKERAEQTEAQTVADGVKLFENAAEMRIQLIFDGKPDEETRALLKGNGFRWSPKNTAWQRDLNENGRRAARRVLEKLAPSGTTEAPAEPDEQNEPDALTLSEFAEQYARQ